MATLTFDGDDLVVRLSRMERLGALRGDRRVPRFAVESVAVTRNPSRELPGVRVRGTAWPQVAPGTWRYKGGRDSWRCTRSGRRSS